MGGDDYKPSTPQVTFEVWKLLLRKDCEMQDKLLAFQALGDSVLEIFWRSGLKPTIEALLDGCSEQIPGRN